MSVIWQTSGKTTNNRGLTFVALEVKIIVSAFLFIGGIHLCLILMAFYQYGDIEENWTERFKRIIRPASMVQVQKSGSVATVGGALSRLTAVPPQQRQSHHHSMETRGPSQPSNSPPVPGVTIVPGTPAPPETNVASSQQQDLLGRDTRSHQTSQPQDAEPHPTANAAAPPSNRSSLPPQPPNDSYPGSRFVPQFSRSSTAPAQSDNVLPTIASTPYYVNYPTGPVAATSERGPAQSDNVLPTFASTPYYVNYPIVPVAASSERGPAPSDVPPPSVSTPYYVNYPTTPAELGPSRSL